MESVGRIPTPDEGRWCSFVRPENGVPVLITSRLAEPEQRKGFNFAITATLPYTAQPNGLPAAGELDRVCRIEDKIIAGLKPAQAMYLGHITGNGAMKVVLYSRLKPPASIMIKTGLIGKQTIDLETRSDASWSLYELEMVPTAREFEDSRNRQLLRTLAEQGDDPTKVRPVDFAAHFPTEALRTAFMQDIAREGFRPSTNPTWEPDADDFWCEFVKDTSIEAPVIGKITSSLRELATKHGGVYDGWATTVEK